MRGTNAAIRGGNVYGARRLLQHIEGARLGYSFRSNHLLNKGTTQRCKCFTHYWMSVYAVGSLVTLHLPFSRRLFLVRYKLLKSLKSSASGILVATRTVVQAANMYGVVHQHRWHCGVSYSTDLAMQ